MDGRAFLQQVTEAEKRSPANRANVLLVLAASLDLLPQDQRQAPFQALLDAAHRLPCRQRARVLERIASEIGQLPQPARAAAWQALIKLAGAPPEPAALLIALCAAVADLGEQHRIDVVRPLLAQAARIAKANWSLGVALAGTVASLPEAARMAGFGMLMKELDGMSVRIRFALGIALADVLRDLPAEHRSAAAAMLMNGSGQWPAKHRFTLLLRLASVLPILPQETMANALHFLIETLQMQRPGGNVSSGDANTPKAAGPLPLPEPDRAAVLCAIGAALSKLPASHSLQSHGIRMTLECATGLPAQNWITVLESVVPGLLNGDLPAQPKPLRSIHEYLDRGSPHLRGEAPPPSGVVQLVLDLCEILRSSKESQIKNLMLRPSKEMRESFYNATQQTTNASHKKHVNAHGEQCQYFLQQLMKNGRPTAHHTAAFLVPLLGSNLDEELIVQHVLARSAQGKDGNREDAIFTPTSDHDEYCSITRTTLSLVLGSVLPSEAKCKAICSIKYFNGEGSFSILGLIAKHGVEHARLTEDWIGIYVDAIAASDLPASLANSLLAGNVMDPDLQGTAMTSTAVSSAIEKGSHLFLAHYAKHLANALLPEESKVALLSGSDPGGDNLLEASQYLRYSTPGSVKHYLELISTLPLTDASKQRLLALFQ